MGIGNIVFIFLLLGAIGLFIYNIRKIKRNINLGLPIDRSDNQLLRWKTMARVALGQSKMITRPIPGLLHIIVYAGFVIINIEVLEILIDGVFGTHRIFSFAGKLYDLLIASFEWLALGVLVSCLIFLIRRNIVRVKRLIMKELNGWPKSDANIILTVEILLMTAFLSMNGADLVLQSRGISGYHEISPIAFPVSTFVSGFFSGMSDSSLAMLERSTWWFHIIGILAFLNYLPYSKHFHIILSFPNVFFSKLTPKGQFDNLQSVTNEVKLMFDPSVVPVVDPSTPAAPVRFGAKDVTDLSWKHLMDAYSCTECGRCTSACPANQTGKLLSPRKIMMDTRDRLEEVGKGIDKNGKDFTDNKDLHSYISKEELWACTSCNACVQECPVNIDPLSIIMDMRRFLVMEQSAAPTELNMMFTNIENNGAPWQFPASERLKWAEE